MSGTSGHCKLVKADTLCKVFNKNWYSSVLLIIQLKIRHYVLANLLLNSWVLLAIENSLSRHNVLHIPHKIKKLCFSVWSKKIAETML